MKLKIKALVARVVGNVVVQSAVRHAATAFAAGVVAVVAAGQPLTVAVIVAAGAAALRAAELVVVAYVQSKKPEVKS